MVRDAVMYQPCWEKVPVGVGWLAVLRSAFLLSSVLFILVDLVLFILVDLLDLAVDVNGNSQ